MPTQFHIYTLPVNLGNGVIRYKFVVFCGGKRTESIRTWKTAKEAERAGKREFGVADNPKGWYR